MSKSVWDEWEEVKAQRRKAAQNAESYANNTPIDDMPTNDMVNHPVHYTSGGIECIDAIEAAISCHKDPVTAMLTGQIIKYLWRWPLKNGAEDLHKAQWYLNRLISKEEHA